MLPELGWVMHTYYPQKTLYAGQYTSFLFLIKCVADIKLLKPEVPYV